MDNYKKICNCGPPYGYSPHVKGGYCRFCWGLEPELLKKKWSNIFTKETCEKLKKTLLIN